MMTNGYEHMCANEFNAALLEHRASGGTFVYFTGWLLDAKRRVSADESVSELHLVAKMAIEAQGKGQVCLTQRCLRKGTDRLPPIYEYRAFRNEGLAPPQKRGARARTCSCSIETMLKQQKRFSGLPCRVHVAPTFSHGL
jgi:hypothetical protein